MNNQITPVNTVAVITMHEAGELFSQKDKFGISFWPSIDVVHEVKIRKRYGWSEVRYFEENSCTVLKFDKSPGDYEIQSRWRLAEAENEEEFSDWSPVQKITILKSTPENEQHIFEERKAAYEILTMTSRLSNGVITLHNPWQLPPKYPMNSGAKWFPTASYEGSTNLLNYSADYYMDPLNYLVTALEELKNKGADFLRWKDLMGEEAPSFIEKFKSRFFSPKPPTKLSVILQFDLDAGVKSFFRVIEALKHLDIVGSVMVHRQCFDWYEWKIDDVGIKSLQELEKNGWEIGYHNNTLSNIQRLERVGDYSSGLLSQARQQFTEDVNYLRNFFKIDVFTHHGGNVFNRYVEPDSDLGIVCVDKRYHPSLWKKITRSFSDGGFVVRPKTLKKFISNLEHGTHFFRLHPVKYGNYEGEPDIIRLPEYSDNINLDETKRKAKSFESLSELEKQALWFFLRPKGRQGIALSHATLDKPISSRFSYCQELEGKVRYFRGLRRESFLRMYPSDKGDPRAFWWRMLDAFSPDGDILNVGALPPSQKEETESFVPLNARILEIDIDPEREPDILGDFSRPNKKFKENFDAVLLFGLPYFQRPFEAVKNCYNFLKPGGIALLGFCADTHPERGGMWRPKDRPIWRPDLYIEPPLTLKTKLWSFDKESLRLLFCEWEGSLKVEFHSHYWFVVGERAGD